MRLRKRWGGIEKDRKGRDGGRDAERCWSGRGERLAKDSEEECHGNRQEMGKVRERQERERGCWVRDGKEGKGC